MKTIPRILLGSRFLFLLYFVYFCVILYQGWFPSSLLSPYWLAYLVLVYVIAEKIYEVFLKRNIDLVYAFPILFIAYMVNFASMILRAQEQLPILNRAEHFITYILATYIVWQFFHQYLPQKVWREHPYYTAILVLSLATFFGVLNEIIELFMDVNFKTQTIGPGFDTNVDLLMNLLGSIVFLCIQLIMHEAEKSGIIKSTQK